MPKKPKAPPNPKLPMYDPDGRNAHRDLFQEPGSAGRNELDRAFRRARTPHRQYSRGRLSDFDMRAHTGGEEEFTVERRQLTPEQRRARRLRRMNDPLVRQQLARGSSPQEFRTIQRTHKLRKNVNERILDKAMNQSKKIRKIGMGLGAAASAAHVGSQIASKPRGKRKAEASRQAKGLLSMGAMAASAKKLVPHAMKGASRIALPFAATLGAVDIGKAAIEGYKTFDAVKEAKKKREYAKKNYGSIEAATRTRKRRKK